MQNIYEKLVTNEDEENDESLGNQKQDAHRTANKSAKDIESIGSILAKAIEQDISDRKRTNDTLFNKADGDLRSKMEKYKKVLKVNKMPLNDN